MQGQRPGPDRAPELAPGSNKPSRWRLRYRGNSPFGGTTAIVAVLGSVVSACMPAAAEAGIAARAEVSSKRPLLGDTVVLEVTVEGDSEGVPQIDISPLENLGVRSQGPPATGHSLQIIGGIRSDSFTYRFRFEIAPRSPGPLTIPPLVIRQGNQQTTTRPIQIEVVGPEQQDWAIVELTASEAELYPGQTVTLSAQVYLKRLVHRGQVLTDDPFDRRNDPPRIKITWLGGSKILKPADSLDDELRGRSQQGGHGFLVNQLFARRSIGFFIDDRITQTPVTFDRDEVERPGPDGGLHSYFRYTLPLPYRAQDPGQFGPLTVQLRGRVYIGVHEGPRGLGAEGRELFVVSAPLTIRVAPVPLVGRPPSFTGGVGLFRVTASVKPTKVHVGDPITVTVQVSGEGTLEDVGPPNLAKQPEWSEDFKIHGDPSVGGLQGDAKVFRFSVRAKNAGVMQLPPVQLSFFEPRSRRFQTALSDPIAIEVLETERLGLEEIVGAAGEGNGQAALQEKTAGLHANYTGPELLHPEGPYRTGPAVWLGVLLGPPVIWLVAFTWHRGMGQQDPVRRRAQGARRRARRQLQLAEGLTREQLPEQIARALALYLADRLDLSPGELTPAEARHHLLALGTPEELAEEFARLVEQCSHGRFAPTSEALDGAALLREAQELIDRVEQAVATGGRQTGSRVFSSARLFILVPVLFVLSPGQHKPDNQSGTRLDRHACLARAGAAFERGVRAEDQATAEEAFSEAISAYQQLLADGVQNGKLLYNLANAYFRAGDLPRAVLYYRLAERLRPQDANIAAGATFVRTRIAYPAALGPTSRLLRVLLLPHYSWSVRQRMQAAVAFYALGWLWLTLQISYRRRWMVVTGFLCLALAVPLGFSAFGQLQYDREHPLGVLVDEQVLVRSGNGDTYEPQFDRPLGAGVEFRLVERRDDWLHIQLLDGKRGWIRRDQAAVARS